MAFLDTTIKDYFPKVYMNPPEGFFFNLELGTFQRSNKDNFDKEWVCLMKKSIHGLKQSRQLWEESLKKGLEQLGSQQDLVNPCLWKYVNNNTTLLFVIYADEIIIASDNDKERNAFVNKLRTISTINDHGPLTWIIGTSIKQYPEKKNISAHQKMYTSKLSETYRKQQPNKNSRSCTNHFPAKIDQYKKGKDSTTRFHPSDLVTPNLETVPPG